MLVILALLASCAVPSVSQDPFRDEAERAWNSEAYLVNHEESETMMYGLVVTIPSLRLKICRARVGQSCYYGGE